MTTYVVTRKSDGGEVYRYQSDSPIEWSGMEFVTCDHAVLPDDPVAVAPPTGRKMSRLDFLRLFTVAERVVLRTAALSSPVLADYMGLLDAAAEVDTSDETTRAGVQMLEAAGLLTAGRAEEVLHG